MFTEVKRTPRPNRVKDDSPDMLPDAPPPFARSWRILYAIVLGELAITIAIFYLFTRIFR